MHTSLAQAGQIGEWHALAHLRRPFVERCLLCMDWRECIAILMLVLELRVQRAKVTELGVVDAIHASPRNCSRGIRVSRISIKVSGRHHLDATSKWNRPSRHTPEVYVFVIELVVDMTMAVSMPDGVKVVLLLVVIVPIFRPWMVRMPHVVRVVRLVRMVRMVMSRMLMVMPP